MKKRRSVVKSHGKRHGNRAKRFGVLVAAVAAAALMISFGGGAHLAASASSQSEQGRAKRYKATRAYVVDKQSGEVRMPTQQEVDEVVANLTALGQRPTEGLPSSTQANGAVAIDLDGGFGGVVLARPNGDGTFETRCVFTLEEGAEFLGLVEDDSSR